MISPAGWRLDHQEPGRGGLGRDSRRRADFDYDNFAQEIDDREFSRESPARWPHALRDPDPAVRCCSSSSSARRRIGEEIIGNINDDGYLTSPVSEIAFRLRRRRSGRWSRCWPDPDPRPAGSRRPRPPECLLIQLRENGGRETLAYRLVADFFRAPHPPSLAGDRQGQTGLSPCGRSRTAADEVAHLEPKPGRLYCGSPG